MPSSLRIFEIVLYSLVNFLPYFLLVLYLFKEDFRFSKSINLCLFVLLVGLEIFVCVWEKQPFGSMSVSPKWLFFSV